MSTLHTMNLALVDIEARLSRELQFSADAEKQILDSLNTVREGLDQLDRSIRAAFTERTRALSAAIGTGKPQPETVDGHAEEALPQPKLVKPKAA
jgi:hypothetical protein